MKVRPEEMSRGELVAHLYSLEAQLRDNADRGVLMHDLQVHQEELEAQQAQLIEAQQALEAARDRYADLFDLAPLGYLLLDTEGVIEEVNVAALRLLGAGDRLRVAHAPLSLFIADDDRRTFREHLRVLGAGAERSETEVRLRGRGPGDSAVVQIYSHLWTHPDTGARRYLTALLDVTDRRRAEEDRRATEVKRRTLAETERALRATNQAKDRFLAALSHELRTPLTPIFLALDALARRADLPQPVETTLRMMRRNVEHEARLIDDLLDVTRIAHDKLHCELGLVKLHPVLRDIHAGFAEEARAAGIDLSLELGAGEPYVLGDVVRLRQVISNLLRNALRHTGRGGGIVLRSGVPMPERVSVTVTDTGDGIAPELLERIFVPFEQADPAHGAGLGLGLAIARGLVEQHAGTIVAHSQGQGSGTTFTVELPTVAPPSQQDERAQGAVDRAARDTKVLLVEDHADSAEAIELGLTIAGYQVVVADSVRAAMAQADRPFDVVVSDLGLPDGSGLDVMRALLLRRPVMGIALSGFGAESDIQATREAGFQRHLVKPVNLSQLVEAIETLMGPTARRA